MDLFGNGCGRRLGKTVESSWAVLATIDVQGASVSLTGSDIDNYDWTAQRLLLTKAATDKVEAAFPGGGQWASIPLEFACFLVSMHGERIFGGEFISYGADVGADFPIIYAVPEAPGPQFQWWLRPMHSSLELNEYASFRPELRNRIEFAELREYFASIGKLRE